MTGRAIERAELTVGDADVGIVQNNVADESYCIAKKPLPQDVCYEAHRVDVVRLDKSDAVVEPEPVPCKGAVKHLTNV